MFQKLSYASAHLIWGYDQKDFLWVICIFNEISTKNPIVGQQLTIDDI